MPGPMRLRLAFFGDVQVDRTITRITDAVADLRPVWNLLANRFAVLETRQFKSEGRYASGGWAPLSPGYAAWKAIHYPGAKILHRTGELERSLTVRPFGVEVLEPHTMIVGSAVDYGEHHQRGAGNLPRRRPVEFRESEKRTWVKAIQRFIVTGRVGVATDAGDGPSATRLRSL